MAIYLQLLPVTQRIGLNILLQKEVDITLLLRHKVSDGLVGFVNIKISQPQATVNYFFHFRTGTI